jgi:cytochrome c biogenesis protein CcmG, thiol:disulfide interchange protein DsbE
VRSRLGVTFVAGVVLLLLPACSGTTATAKATQVELAPLKGGAPVQLASYAGRPLVVNLWASWCTPCRVEMPMLQQASEQLGRRASFVGVTSDDHRSALLSAAGKAGVTYPLLYDKGGIAQADLAVTALPTTFFFDAHGHLVATHAGVLTRSALMAELHRLGLVA